jgi:hypothetical protein
MQAIERVSVASEGNIRRSRMREVTLSRSPDVDAGQLIVAASKLRGSLEISHRD